MIRSSRRRRALWLVARLTFPTCAWARPRCDSAAALAARQAVDTSCSCGAGSHGDFASCAVRVVADLIRHGALAPSCATPLRRCAVHSTCGRPGRVACCRTTPRHASVCKITTAARCAAQGGCAGAGTSCCETCGLDGCASAPSTTIASTSTTTTTTTRSTTTTLDPDHCGNGIIEPPSEQCDGDSICTPSCTIQRYACCQYGTGADICSADVAPFIQVPLQQQECDVYGGTFAYGSIAGGPQACPTDVTKWLGPCIPGSSLPAPVTLCCQRTVDACDDVTASEHSVLDSWYLQCASETFTRLPGSVVVGTCGADGHCLADQR